MSSAATTIGSAAVSGTLFNICSRRASGDAPNVPEIGVSGSRGGSITVSVYGPGGTFWIDASGSINLTKFVNDPFGEQASFDFDKFRDVSKVSTRALDNVLDATLWPLQEQADEAANKRRIGLGFTGLGNALTMLGLRYDSDAGRSMAANIARTMRDSAYEASAELAQEKGAFPLFDAEKFLAAPHCASRLPEPLKSEIRVNGIRNSHLLSIAPTGTISLAFASNASGGIEPTFSWTYVRKKRMPDGTKQEYAVEDYAYRLYRRMGGNERDLPDAFVSAMQMSARDHMRMSATVQPYIDAAISKTVNVPEDYPFEEFKSLYLEAWHAGLKGITTYRPNNVIGSVLEVTKDSHAREPQDLKDDPDRRVRLDSTPNLRLKVSSGRAVPIWPAAILRGPTWSSFRNARNHSRSLSGRWASLRCRSKCGSTAPNNRAASVRSRKRCRWTCAAKIVRG